MRLTCNDIIRHQVNNYYPFGGIMDEGSRRGADVQNHLYNGKELDRMHGLNLYDYSARQYDPAVCQFTSMDPLCEKYYHISPYAYCAGNPVKYVDPDGKDIWSVDKMGNIQQRIHDDKIDCISLVDANKNPVYDLDGKPISISFEYGTISQSVEKTVDNKEYNVFLVSGDENGTKLFEFFAGNSAVEYSQAKTSNDVQGLNIITTSHDYNSESGMGNYIWKNLQKDNNTLINIREINHNHPGKTSKPSTNGDIPNGKWYLSYFPNITLNICVSYGDLIKEYKYYNYNDLCK